MITFTEFTVSFDYRKYIYARGLGLFSSLICSQSDIARCISYGQLLWFALCLPFTFFLSTVHIRFCQPFIRWLLLGHKVFFVSFFVIPPFYVVNRNRVKEIIIIIMHEPRKKQQNRQQETRRVCASGWFGINEWTCTHEIRHSSNSNSSRSISSVIQTWLILIDTSRVLQLVYVDDMNWMRDICAMLHQNAHSYTLDTFVSNNGQDALRR